MRMREDIAEARPGRHRKTEPVTTVGDGALWERLRACRKRLADAQGVPPYVIFHDRTLAEMAALRPATPADLLQVSGIGQAKLERYGQAFLAVLNAVSD